MITRKNGKKGYCRMEKHRDFEFTIHESEASMSSTDKRKNERRYRFVFRVVLAFIDFLIPDTLIKGAKSQNASSNTIKCFKNIK